MTRKKFVKNCMSLGLPRNEANGLATLVRAIGVPFKDYRDMQVQRLPSGKYSVSGHARHRISVFVPSDFNHLYM